MKRKFGFLLALALFLSACSTPAGSAGSSAAPASAGSEETSEETPEETPEETSEETADALTPGTYTGTAMGFHDNVTVEVEVDETSILSVTVTDCKETKYISDNAIVKLPQDIVDAQSVNVDLYSGCTISSFAVRAAAKAALEQAGDISAFSEKPEKPAATDEELETDIVVIGGGQGGLVSAITAAEAGRKVILLEKLDRLGGSTVESGGIFYATNSPINGDQDNDPEDMVRYWQERAEGNADENMLRIAAEGSGESLAKLQEWGVMFADEVGTAGTSPALRAHYASNAEAAGASTDGVDFIVPLKDKAAEIGIEILLGTEATELISEDGAVTGVKAVSDEHNYTIKAKAVIIATGGYDLSKEMMEEHSPDLAGTFALSSAGNKGDGIKMAEAVGAATNYTGGVIGFKMIDVTKHYLEGSNMLCWLGPLAVTSKGVRFGNESADYPIMCTQLVEARRDGSKTYFIIDSSVEMFSGLAELAVAANCGVKAETIEELAGLAGIDAEALQTTIDAYNATVESGEPDEYGKVNTAPVVTGPFYAVEVKPATLGTIGGLLISEKAEVLDTEGNPIPNLYACGEVANSQFLYKEYPASGSSISITTTFGRIAGTEAARKAE